MLNKFLILLFVPSCNILFGQADSSLIYYDLGSKAFSNKAYTLSDSMFSLSIKLKPHPDTYYSRAVTRQKLDNQVGYWEDLCRAGAMGDKESDSLFCKKCGTRDIAYTDIHNKPATLLNHYYYNRVYQSPYKSCNIAAKYDTSKKFIGFAEYIPDLAELEYSESENMPDFPGGINAFYTQMRQKMQMPIEAGKKGIYGKVFVKFIINRLGYIDEVFVLRGIEDCKSCDAEALRLVANSPRWKPGYTKGKYVRVYYTLPILFRNK